MIIWSYHIISYHMIIWYCWSCLTNSTNKISEITKRMKGALILEVLLKVCLAAWNNQVQLSTGTYRFRFWFFPVYLNWDKSQIGDPEPNDHAGKEDCALLRTEGCKEFEHSAWADFDCSKKVMRITCHTDQHNYFDETFTMNPLCEFQAGSGKNSFFFFLKISHLTFLWNFTFILMFTDGVTRTPQVASKYLRKYVIKKPNQMAVYVDLLA